MHEHISKMSRIEEDNPNIIDSIVSFLMESGVEMLLKDLKLALDREASIRIPTGNYLNIT